MNAIVAAANRVQHVVLGGDIFDFRWSVFPSVDHTADEATLWLERFLSAIPNAKVHYLLGNHDHNEVLIARLDQLAEERPNFEWSPYVLRKGTTVFLHGDVANGKMTEQDLIASRENWKQHARKGNLLNWLYDVVVFLRIHRLLANCLNPNRRVAKKLLFYLKSAGHGPGDGVRDVYFGHTHKPVLDYTYDGVRFRNGGATVKGLRFHILELELPADED